MNQSPINKALCVIASCRTEQQLASASRYARLALANSTDPDDFERINKAIKAAIARMQPRFPEAACA